RLRDAQEHGLGGGGLAALREHALDQHLEIEAVYELERALRGVARLVDADLAEHLPDDDLDVLVVDRHALAAVDALDLLDEVALHRLATTRLEILLRVDRAIGDLVTGADLLTVLDHELGVVGDDVLAAHNVLAGD